MNILFTGGADDGEVFISGEATAVGWGAWSGGDGSNALINYGGGDLKNLPGRGRGGRATRCGSTATRCVPTPAARAGGAAGSGSSAPTRCSPTTSPCRRGSSERRRLAWGLCGGAAGEVSTVVLEQPDGTKSSLLKAAGVAAGRGTRVTV